MTTSVPTISAIRPLCAVPGGRIVVSGVEFDIAHGLPEVLVGGIPARVVHASTRELTMLVPEGLDGGRTTVRVSGVTGERPLVEIGAPIATGLHQVDNPVFDAAGNLYLTFSGSRGQQPPVSIFIVRPGGTREPFVTELANATSMAIDREGRLHVSSRFDGSVHRIDAKGSVTTVATDLGVACGIAFGPDDALYVGDRSGSILRVVRGEVSVFATLQPSVAAFHLAFGPDGYLYVAAPTLSSSDLLQRISPTGDVAAFGRAFGRPQGIAFDDQGRLYVVDALAGSGGVYRMDVSRPSDLDEVLSGGSLIGLAFDPAGGVVACSAETAYRLDLPLRGPQPSHASS